MSATVASHPVTDSLLPVYKRAPMEFVRGEGVDLIDADGKRYLDFTSGIAVNALGYGDVALVEVMKRAAEGLIHTSNLFRTAPGEQLADKLVASSFADRVFFCNSGAEANEGAFKFARRWARNIGGPAKHEIFSLRGAFHGRLFASVAATDRPQYRMPFRPLAGGISILERDLDDLDISLNSETTAALILEPIQGEGGVRVLEPEFVRAVRQLTTERRIALIFDEIQCGLGRTGHLFAYERLGVTPDLLTLAKPIAAGLPMGAILATEDVASAMQPGDHGTTFGGGPFVASVASHVFDRLSDPQMLSHVRESGTWFADQLHGIASRTQKIRAIRGAGLMWGFDAVDPAAEIIGRAREAGLLLVSAGEHTIRILPPLVITRDELGRGLAVLEQVLSA
ncbi:MAG: acetylornithine transaminase [Gemmatimonadetes bacterium]|jgi:acetylornithine/N-succinyldiaminopimelate aminotransferase|nr:acetylornithine transaminase [Gemmatimonadota bacterium]MCC7323198.1 acetylornithine transaminase [Gemmatimonadaceae bacterium]MBK6457038.1 acetylornithine transaminase [Gemmatimonadota bacterium]MBK7831497.1 acetylornithine transaminase [Gemmatimonadota bacterium]MBK8059664.1 acetylornithine transaminase [Gemmatimonadota bacterium]